MKLAQREELKEQQRLRNAGIETKRGESEPNDEDDDEHTYKGHRGRRVKARTMMEVAEQV